jgi:hypothetical protein
MSAVLRRVTLILALVASGARCGVVYTGTEPQWHAACLQLGDQAYSDLQSCAQLSCSGSCADFLSNRAPSADCTGCLFSSCSYEATTCENDF